MICFIKPKLKILRSILTLSLLLGALFTPLQLVKANFFSSFFGDQAYAEGAKTASNTPKLTEFGSNSQNIPILQANVSSVSILQDKKDSKKDDTIDTSANVNIVSDNAILPATGPMGVFDGRDTSFSLETSVYVVRKGDSISAIASMFDVSIDTILATNDMKKGDKLVEGDTLFILPVSGIEHTVTKGQTLKGIATLYKVDVSDIALYNGITEDAVLAIGDDLIIPGAEMFDEGSDKPATNLGTSAIKDQNYYIAYPIKNLIGYFINPLPTGHKTRGLHGPGHRGIDIGAPVGAPIYASASGIVTITKSGCLVGQKRCGGGYGNMAVIQHSNGTKTLYGHMSKLNTRTGASVSQGKVIGFAGSTGRSTGPHLHFEVFSAKNPGSDWSWAN